MSRAQSAEDETVRCRLCETEIDADWNARVDHLTIEHDLFQLLVETMTEPNPGDS